MKKYLAIEKIWAIEVLDSRGNPTVQVKAEAQGICGTAIVPSGASTGSFEAVELRDNDKSRYLGKGVKKAVDNVNKIIGPALKGMNALEQNKLDKMLIELDGTENKQKLGANATLGVSLAIAKLAANYLNIPLYNYLGGVNAKKLPVPMMNILNGGKHAGNTVNIQEFMIVPVGAKDFTECMEMGVKVYHTLKRVLKEKKMNTAVGDEGGFAPDLENDEEAIKLIVEAIEIAGYKPGKEIALALDVAASEMYQEALKIGKEGEYYFWKTENLKTTEEMIEYFENLINKYPIISIEDALGEEDWKGWIELNKSLGNKIQIVGDDLFVTNITRLKRGIVERSANTILIKPNQIGTLTETLDVIELAKNNGYKTIISHRSGETEDTMIADIAVAVNSAQIKTGAPCRTDRVAKYNRLLNIENEIR
ncbi:MAG: phosphopyruvate hydratase [Clostridia bacterium]|nr:phosphopyruvate hydratase [Clostridia bacterium]